MGHTRKLVPVDPMYTSDTLDGKKVSTQPQPYDG